MKNLRNLHIYFLGLTLLFVALAVTSCNNKSTEEEEEEKEEIQTSKVKNSRKKIKFPIKNLKKPGGKSSSKEIKNRNSGNENMSLVTKFKDLDNDDDNEDIKELKKNNIDPKMLEMCMEALDNIVKKDNVKNNKDNPKAPSTNVAVNQNDKKQLNHNIHCNKTTKDESSNKDHRERVCTPNYSTEYLQEVSNSNQYNGIKIPVKDVVKKHLHTTSIVPNIRNNISNKITKKVSAQNTSDNNSTNNIDNTNNNDNTNANTNINVNTNTISHKANYNKTPNNNNIFSANKIRNIESIKQIIKPIKIDSNFPVIDHFMCCRVNKDIADFCIKYRNQDTESSKDPSYMVQRYYHKSKSKNNKINTAFCIYLMLHDMKNHNIVKYRLIRVSIYSESELRYENLGQCGIEIEVFNDKNSPYYQDLKKFLESIGPIDIDNIKQISDEYKYQLIHLILSILGSPMSPPNINSVEEEKVHDKENHDLNLEEQYQSFAENHDGITNMQSNLNYSTKEAPNSIFKNNGSKMLAEQNKPLLCEPHDETEVPDGCDAELNISNKSDNKITKMKKSFKKFFTKSDRKKDKTNIPSQD